jgi:predicted porin
MFNLGEISMKKTLVALAALAATASFAQSSVTLYGVADVWVGSLKQTASNATGTADATARQLKIDSGGLSGSRWGMRVTEDLGGGLSANVVAESGFNIDAGSSAQGGLLFGRQAFVGLKGGFGSLNFGRQYSPYDSVKGALSIQNSTTFDATNGGFGNVPAAQYGALTGTGAVAVADAVIINNALSGRLGGWIGYTPRINNSVRYDTPNFGGITGSVMIGLGENKTTTVGATRTNGFNVSYANGPLSVAVAYQDEILSKTAASTGKISNTMLAGNYDLGVAKLGLLFNRFKVGSAAGSAKANEYAFGASVPMGAVTLKAQYARSKFTGAGADNSLGLEVQYALSKRSTAYLGVNNTKVDAGNFVTGADAKNSVIATGFRHTF